MLTNIMRRSWSEIIADKENLIGRHLMVQQGPQHWCGPIRDITHRHEPPNIIVSITLSWCQERDDTSEELMWHRSDRRNFDVSLSARGAFEIAIMSTDEAGGINLFLGKQPGLYYILPPDEYP